MFGNWAYGIDLGSNMIKIYSKKSDEIIKERNMIAIRKKNQILATGDAAYEMFEKNPQDVEVSSTMSGGMIANITYLEIVLQKLLQRSSKRTGRHPVIYFAVPVDMTEIEKHAYYAVARQGKFRKSQIYLVEKPVADAIALGIPINKTKGAMIVNIGAATTEISVIADSRVIISKIIPLGGDQLNQDIINMIRRKYNFFISQKTAVRLKASLVNLSQDKKIARQIVGVDCVSGLPREFVVTSAAINEAVISSLQAIGNEIRSFLERTPPQIRREIAREGIYLTGGSTRIGGIDAILADLTGHPVLLSQYTDLCTIYGLREIVTHDALHHWAFVPKRTK